jgi:hypothetical protein
VRPEAVPILLAQYRECSAQHMLSYSLTWQVPTIAVGVSGFLIAAIFGYHVSDPARVIIAAAGTVFVFAMTAAVERNRLLQLHRRKDLIRLEQLLEPLGMLQLVWNLTDMYDSAAPPILGLHLHGFEFFKILRSLLYAIIICLAVLTVLAVIDAAGANIFS